MNTNYKQKEDPTGAYKPVSAWQTPKFQIFAAVTVAAAVLLTVVATSNLKGSVDNLTQQKMPQLGNQVDKLQVQQVDARK